jgi:hypothetical protein
MASASRVGEALGIGIQNLSCTVVHGFPVAGGSVFTAMLRTGFSPVAETGISA